MHCTLLLAAIAIAAARPQTGDEEPETVPPVITRYPPGCGKNAAADAAWTTPPAPTRSPNCGSTPNGQQVDKGRYYYTCTNGEYKPAGCLDAKHVRVPIGSSYEENAYALKCVLTATQELSIEFEACIVDGKRVSADETADAAWFWYKCTRMPDGRLQTSIAGCVSSGKRVNLKERVVQGGYVYECRKEASTNEGVALWPVACANDADGGKEVEVGQQFTGTDKNLYECALDTQTKLLVKRIVSCQTASGKQLKDGETFRDGDTLYKCFLGTTQATLVVIGCAGPNDAVKAVNAVWLVDAADAGNPGLKYEMQCQQSGANNATAVAKTVCVYVDPSTHRQYRVQPGCFVKVDDTHAAGCKQLPAAGLQAYFFELAKLDVAVENKLSLCS